MNTRQSPNKDYTKDWLWWRDFNDYFIFIEDRSPFFGGDPVVLESIQIWINEEHI
jgi:hypothetical protein